MQGLKMWAKAKKGFHHTEQLGTFVKVKLTVKLYT